MTIKIQDLTASQSVWTDANKNLVSIVGGVTTANLTPGTIPKAATATTLADSLITESATLITVNPASADIDFHIKTAALPHSISVSGSSGFVGINRQNPISLLTLYTANYATYGNVNSTGLGLVGAGNLNDLQQIGLGYNGTYYPVIVGARTASAAGYTIGDFYIATRELTTDTAPIERMTIKSTGFIGINRTTPASLLTINTDAYDEIGKIGELGIHLYSPGYVGRIQQIGFGDYSTYCNSAIGQIMTSAAGTSKGDLFFATRDVTTDTIPTERMRITSAGLVKILADAGMTLGADSDLTVVVNTDVIFTNVTADSDILFKTKNGGAAVSTLIQLDASEDIVVLPKGVAHINYEDATTNTVIEQLRLTRTTSGTAALGMGGSINFYSDNAAGTMQLNSSIVSTLNGGASERVGAIEFQTAYDGSLKTALRLYIYGGSTASNCLAIYPAYGIYDSPRIGVEGSGTDVDITIAPKGAGRIYISTGLHIGDVTGDPGDNNLLVDGTVRCSAANYRRYYHSDISSFNPGASGATWVPANTTSGGKYSIGGFRQTTAAHILEGAVDVRGDWDGASDLKIEIYFENGAAGSCGPYTIDFTLTVYYKQPNEGVLKSQVIPLSTVVGAATIYTQFAVTATIDYDLVGNVVEAGDIIAWQLALNTADSEIDNVIINHVSFYYNTTHVGVESADV